MKDNLKILYFVDSLEFGGIQSILLNWSEKLINNNVEVDFLVLDYGKKSNIEIALEKMGCKIFRLNNIKLDSALSYIKYSNSLNEFFAKNHDYDAVHLHSSSKNYLVLKYAKKYGIKKRIIHSHSTNFETNSIVKKTVGNVFKIFVKKYATLFLACSYESGLWLFGKKIVNSKNFKIIKNAIDYNKFKYNKTIRDLLRQKLGIEDDCFVLGHVGRMATVKNHRYLLEIFAKYHQKNSKSKLLLVGDGELRKEIEQKAKDLGIQENVLITGFVDNPYDYMQTMDTLLMPSLYEGLPMVLIEAQVNGLNCLVSDKVSREAKITPSIKYLALDEIEKWVSSIDKDSKRVDNYLYIKESGFILDDLIYELMKIYGGKDENKN